MEQAERPTQLYLLLSDIVADWLLCAVYCVMQWQYTAIMVLAACKVLSGHLLSHGSRSSWRLDTHSTNTNTSKAHDGTLQVLTGHAVYQG